MKSALQPIRHYLEGAMHELNMILLARLSILSTKESDMAPPSVSRPGEI